MLFFALFHAPAVFSLHCGSLPQGMEGTSERAGRERGCNDQESVLCGLYSVRTTLACGRYMNTTER